MVTIRKANDRGHFQNDWLNSYHTFSFGSYQDPNHMGFQALRVINEDRVKPGAGFATHSHHDMEIITVVLSGSVAHKDSMGNIATIHPGEIQRMTAGTGISHSEYNPSAQETAHFLQIWMIPDQQNLPPSYEQIAIPPEERLGKLCLIASPDGRDRSVKIHQNAELYSAILEPQQTLTYTIKPDRKIWLQITNGSITLNHQTLQTSDAISITSPQEITIAAHQQSEILLFDLA